MVKNKSHGKGPHGAGAKAEKPKNFKKAIGQLISFCKKDILG